VHRVAGDTQFNPATGKPHSQVSVAAYAAASRKSRSRIHGRVFQRSSAYELRGDCAPCAPHHAREPLRWRRGTTNRSRRPSNRRAYPACKRLYVKGPSKHEDFIRAGLGCHNLCWDGTRFLSWTTSIGGRRIRRRRGTVGGRRAAALDSSAPTAGGRRRGSRIGSRFNRRSLSSSNLRYSNAC
jgi:hypothetical protein